MKKAVKAKKTMPEGARDWATAVARLAEERNAEDILVLDLRGYSPVTDYFVIATGTSDRQICAVADEIEALGLDHGWRVWKSAGRQAGDWVILDFVDVVVHLFNRKLRSYYDLELIWGEAPRVDWSAPTAKLPLRRR